MRVTFRKCSHVILIRQLAIIFTVFSAGVANIGLSQLITISVPVLVAIYPLAIVLIFLTFAEPLFKGTSGSTSVEFIVNRNFCIVDGLKAAGVPLEGLYSFFGQYLPLFDAGMGWLLPALIGAIIGYALSFNQPTEPAELKKAN